MITAMAASHAKPDQPGIRVAWSRLKFECIEVRTCDWLDQKVRDEVHELVGGLEASFAADVTTC